MTNYFYTFDVVANDHRRPNVQSLPIKEQNTSCILSQDVSIFLMRFLRILDMFIKENITNNNLNR